MLPYRGTFVVGITSAGNQELTINWILSLQRVGYDTKHVVLMCADRMSYKFFRERGYAAVRLNKRAWAEISGEIGWPLQTPPETKDTLTIYSEPYLILVKNRLALLLYLLMNGATVLFHDVDVVYLKRFPNGIDRAIDLLHAQPNKTVLMMFNREPTEFIEYNMGLFIVRPSRESIEIFAALNAYMFDKTMQESEIDDQNLFNMYVLGTRYNKDTAHLKAFVGGLPFKEFLPGHTTFANRAWPPKNGPFWPMIQSNWSITYDHETPGVVHANWVLSYEKPPRMKEFGVYWANDNELLKQANLLPEKQLQQSKKQPS